MLDLRGLSFIESTGLHLLVALDQRAQRDGFQLTLLAPAAPIDRAIQVSGLDQTLPFATRVDAVETEPAILTRGSWKRGVEDVSRRVAQIASGARRRQEPPRA